MRKGGNATFSAFVGCRRIRHTAAVREEPGVHRGAQLLVPERSVRRPDETLRLDVRLGLRLDRNRPRQYILPPLLLSFNRSSFCSYTRHRCKTNVFYVFYIGHVFMFLTFFLFSKRFLFKKNVGKETCRIELQVLAGI